MLRRIAAFASIAAFLGGVAACAVPTTGSSRSGCDDDTDCGESKSAKKAKKAAATNELGLPEVALKEDQETPPAAKTTTPTTDAPAPPPPPGADPDPAPVVVVPDTPAAGSCYSGTLGRYLEPSGCYQRKADGIWFQCKDTLWYRNVSGGVGPFGACTSIYPL